MNIAALVNIGNNIALQPKGQQQATTANNQLFGNVFGQILSSQQVQQSIPLVPNAAEKDVVQDLLAILESSSLEELDIVIGSKEWTVNPKELKELLSKLLTEDTEPAIEIADSNVWDLLAGINEQATKLTDAIVLSLNGQGPVPPVEAKQAVELLKVAQLIGNKSDLTLKQESTLFDLKQLLDGVKESVSLLVPNEQKTQANVSVAMHVLKTTVQPIVGQQASKESILETKEVTTTVQTQTSTVVQTKVETVSITLPTEKPAQSEEFVKELQKVMNRIQFGQTGGANRLVIKLYPEQLGTVRIELIQKDGIFTAKMLASTALGKELLDSNSNHLRQSLVSQNIQLDKLEITQALQDTNRQERNQSFQESFRQQQQEQQNNNNDETEEPSSFGDFLKEMEV